MVGQGRVGVSSGRSDAVQKRLYVSKRTKHNSVGIADVADNLALCHGTNDPALLCVWDRQHTAPVAIQGLALSVFTGIAVWSVCCCPNCGEDETKQRLKSEAEDNVRPHSLTAAILSVLLVGVHAWQWQLKAF